MAVAQSEPGLADVCGEQPSWICQTIYDTTSHEGAARFSDVLMGKVGGIVLVLVVACIVNLLVRRAINRFTARLSDPASTETLSRFRRRTPTVVADAVGLSTRAAARARTMAHVLRSVSTAAIWSIATVTVLGELGINLGPLVASAGIAGVALGFGAQSLVEDVISGFFMLVEDQYGVGDIIEIGDVSNPLASGTVEEVNLRTTRIRDVNGTVWHVPNGIIKRVGNMSQQWARALVDVSVAHGTDVDAAQEVIKETADALWRDPQWDGVILEEPEVWGVEQLTAEGITIRLVVKTRGAEQFGVTRELRRRLLMALTADDIDIGQTTVLVRDERDEDEDDEEVGAAAGAGSAGTGTVDTVPGPLTR
jgi:small-conductance mechanosensitive channel